MSYIIKFIQEYYEIFPTIITALGGIYGLFKSASNFTQNAAIKKLELFKKYFSKEELTKLDQESKLIQSLTCNVFPCFAGVTYKEVKKLVKANIDHNFLIFFELYRKGLVNIDAKLTSEGKKKIEKMKLKKYSFVGLFLLWCIAIIIILSFYFPLPLSISGWFILGIGVGIPEIFLLNYLDLRENLETFNKP
ncbi:hypothetical protein [uncultured Aggregatibacter sp.]|uniref:hypothetical protein n=1 Tax=uncultured Aggregatibacter sp. TaxID=470564 RepID=UPI001A5A7AC4|nr:hypothetical protein [uncultured Aggregatibacter sp.]VTX76251.1 Uncharacterised protein [uncultured Aggregatibacter sp.]